MSYINICDVCGKEGRMPFHITENSDGRKWDACSVACLNSAERGTAK